MNQEAGGKHYGDALQPWDLQKCMEQSSTAFVTARRADAIKYSFRIKGDENKQLDDLKKARHCLDAAISYIEEINKYQEQDTDTPTCPVSHDLENAKYINRDTNPISCLVCGNPWPIDQISNFKNALVKTVNGHILITPETCKCGGIVNCPVCIGGLGVCKNCNAAEAELDIPCAIPF